MSDEPVRFAAIGLAHLHVFAQVGALLSAGGELAAFHSDGDDLAEGFAKLFPQARRASDRREILEDDSIRLVASAAAPEERAALAADAMRHGKDVLVDKPGAVSPGEVTMLRRVQAETRRRWAVFFAERLTSRATVRAAELVRAGAVGEVVQTLGLGPHQVGLAPRPDWFWDPARSGGILGDLASHQVDQFLHFTGAERAELVSAQVANRAHPERPGFEDFGELVLRAPTATGYARVDWLTPAGLGTWGDVRLFVLGTEGALELRKNCDLAGREGGDHLFLVDGSDVRHIACDDVALPFARQLLDDVRQRTETAIGQAHAFLATDLALEAQARATRLGRLPGAAPGDV